MVQPTKTLGSFPWATGAWGSSLARAPRRVHPGAEPPVATPGATPAHWNQKVRGSALLLTPWFCWSGKPDSNRRPSAWEADALPTELFPRRGLCFCREGRGESRRSAGRAAAPAARAPLRLARSAGRTLRVTDLERRIAEGVAELRARFGEKMRATPSLSDPAPQGEGPKNRHGMPKEPPGQNVFGKGEWPVLDLGRDPRDPDRALAAHAWTAPSRRRSRSAGRTSSRCRRRTRRPTSTASRAGRSSTSPSAASASRRSPRSRGRGPTRRTS